MFSSIVRAAIRALIAPRDGRPRSENENNNNNNGENSITKVIVVLNTDKVRTVQGASSLQDLSRVSLGTREGKKWRKALTGSGGGGGEFEWPDEDGRSGGGGGGGGDMEDHEDNDVNDELQELGSIGLRMAQLSNNTSVVGHVDSTLLSLVMDVLLKHENLGSVVMLRKSSDESDALGEEIIGDLDPSQTMLKLMSNRRALSASNTITTRDGTRVLLVGEESASSENEPVFRYRPSRAERSFLEERF